MRSSASRSYSLTASSTQRRAGANVPALRLLFARSRLIKTAARSSTVSRHPIRRGRPGIAAIRFSQSALRSRPRPEASARGLAVSVAGNRSLRRVHGAAQHRDVARRGRQAAGTDPDRGLPALRRRRNGQSHKEDMRALAYTKTDHTPEEIALLQDYCIEDDSDGDAAVHARCCRTSIYCAHRFAAPS